MTDHSDHHRKAALRHEEAAKNHDRSATFWHDQGMQEEAGLQRKLADYERDGAELERQWAELTEPDPAGPAVSNAERARKITRENAEHLSVVLSRTAQALEQTAAVAEQHAQRRERSGRSDDAADERGVADRAREYAQRARAHAEEWHNLATR